MSIFRRAMEREQWEVAALCLALGTMEAATKLSRDALSGLRKALDGKSHQSKERRKGVRTG